MLHGGMVVGHDGAYEHGHGHTCICQVCTNMDIWLHGVEFIRENKAYAQVQ